MGITYTKITLKNAGDVISVQRGLIEEKDVRALTVEAMVDTGSGSLVISEELCRKLGLTIVGLRGATVAGGGKTVCKLTEPVTIHWEDRFTTCHALVMPKEDTVLLGAIPLEDMDLMVDPVNQRLVGVHGNEIVCLVKPLKLDRS